MMIQTEHLEKVYKNGFKAVTDLSLHVEKGDIFGFLGPNGAGKTTTIRMLDGLLEPTAGKVCINGVDIRKNPIDIKRIVGVVPESHGYYYWMTAKEYLQYFNSLFNSQKSNDKYIDDLLEKVGLVDKKNVTVGQFSRGMKQRLGIAKSLINKPKIIFLDEPTLGLDPRGQKEIQQLLLDINNNDNITIFITSHLLKDIEVMCNKVCIIKNGVLVEQGSIKELQDKYMSHYTMLVQTSDNDKALSMLSDVEKIRSVITCEDGLEVKFVRGLSDSQIGEVKHQMLSTVFNHNIDIKEMSHKSLSMEDIFFKATEAAGNL
ncbi:MAG: ABC transporter ATP-binding protein [Eubacteriales bacterium]|nr:ABC transporter ATP-binding protein [Eubacteriales bacterium]